jgi:hemerythrin
MRKKVKELYEEWQREKAPEKIKDFLENEFRHWIQLHVARWDSETAMHIGDNM